MRNLRNKPFVTVRLCLSNVDDDASVDYLASREEPPLLCGSLCIRGELRARQSIRGWKRGAAARVQADDRVDEGGAREVCESPNWTRFRELYGVTVYRGVR